MPEIDCQLTHTNWRKKGVFSSGQNRVSSDVRVRPVRITIGKHRDPPLVLIT